MKLPIKFFDKRRQKYLAALSDLKKEVKLRGLEPNSLFDNDDLANYYAYFPISYFTSLHWKVECDLNFLRLVLTFQKRRTLSVLPYQLGLGTNNGVCVGDGENPNFAEEWRRYEQRMRGHELALADHRKNIARWEVEVTRIKASEAYATYLKDYDAYERSSCGQCGGWGYIGGGKSGEGTDTCSSCRGAGYWLSQPTSPLPKKPDSPRPPTPPPHRVSFHAKVL